MSTVKHKDRTRMEGFTAAIGDFFSYQAQTLFNFITAIPRIPNAVDSAVDTFLARMVVKLTKPRQDPTPSAKSRSQTAGERLYDLLFNGALAVVPPEPSATASPHESWTDWLLGFGFTTSSSTESAELPVAVMNDRCGCPNIPFVLAYQCPAIDYVPKTRNVYRHPMNVCDMWTPFFQPDHSLTAWDDMYGKFIPSGGGKKSVGPPPLHVRIGDAAISSIDHAEFDYYIASAVILLFVKRWWQHRYAARADDENGGGADSEATNDGHAEGEAETGIAPAAISDFTSGSPDGSATNGSPNEATTNRSLDDGTTNGSTNYITRPTEGNPHSVPNQSTSQAISNASSNPDISSADSTSHTPNQTTVPLPPPPKPSVPKEWLAGKEQDITEMVRMKAKITRKNVFETGVKLSKAPDSTPWEDLLISEYPNDKTQLDWYMVFNAENSNHIARTRSFHGCQPFSFDGLDSIHWFGLPALMETVIHFMTSTPNVKNLFLERVEQASRTDYLLYQLNQHTLLPRLTRLELKDTDVTLDQLSKFCKTRHKLAIKPSRPKESWEVRGFEMPTNLGERRLELKVHGSTPLSEQTVARLNGYLRNGYRPAFRRLEIGDCPGTYPQSKLEKELRRPSEPDHRSTAQALPPDPIRHRSTSSNVKGRMHELPPPTLTSNGSSPRNFYLDEGSGLDDWIAI